MDEPTARPESDGLGAPPFDSALLELLDGLEEGAELPEPVIASRDRLIRLLQKRRDLAEEELMLERAVQRPNSRLDPQLLEGSDSPIVVAERSLRRIDRALARLTRHP